MTRKLNVWYSLCLAQTLKKILDKPGNAHERRGPDNCWFGRARGKISGIRQDLVGLLHYISYTGLIYMAIGADCNNSVKEMKVCFLTRCRLTRAGSGRLFFAESRGRRHSRAVTPSPTTRPPTPTHTSPVICASTTEFYPWPCASENVLVVAFPELASEI